MYSYFVYITVCPDWLNPASNDKVTSIMIRCLIISLSTYLFLGEVYKGSSLSELFISLLLKILWNDKIKGMGGNMVSRDF